MSDASKPSRNLRPWFALGAVIAAGVAGVFGFIGDGVESEAPGIAGWIITYAHTLVWVLLAIALTIAAIHNKWSRPAGIVAVSAAVVYGIFLVTLFTSGRVVGAHVSRVTSAGLRSSRRPRQRA